MNTPPKHYARGKIQPWDYIIDQDMTYCIGSAVKYLSRYRDKGKAINDLEKAINFINREIRRLRDVEH